MRRVLAIIVAILVSVIWLAIPASVITAALGLWSPQQYLPEQLQGIDLDQLAGVDLQDLQGIDGINFGDLLDSTPVAVPIVDSDTPGDEPLEPTADEPEVVIETNTPTPIPPTDTPSPIATATATPTAEPTPTEEAVVEEGLDETTTETEGTQTDEDADDGTDGETTETAETPSLEPTAAVTTTLLNVASVHAGPGTSFDVIDTLDANTVVNLVGRDPSGEWYLLDDGTWVFGILLRNRPEVPIVSPPPPASTPTAEEVEETEPGEAEPGEIELVEPVVEESELEETVERVAITATVNADSNLRAGPGTEFDVVGGANFGSEVTIVGVYEQGDWYLLQDGTWIFADLIEETDLDVPQVTAEGEYVGTTISAVTTPPASEEEDEDEAGDETAVEGEPAAAVANVLANLRAGPGTGFEIVGTANPGDVLVVVGRNAAGDWLLLEDDSWIFAELVENVPADLPVIEDSEAQEEAGAGATETAEAAASEEESTEVEASTANEAEAAGAQETADTEAESSQGDAQPTVNIDANLRQGPGTDFEIGDTITAGTVVTITARNAAGDWLQLDNDLWIFADLVDNAPEDLPVAPTN